ANLPPAPRRDRCASIPNECRPGLSAGRAGFRRAVLLRFAAGRLLTSAVRGRACSCRFRGSGFGVRIRIRNAEPRENASLLPLHDLCVRIEFVIVTEEMQRSVDGKMRHMMPERFSFGLGLALD